MNMKKKERLSCVKKTDFQQLIETYRDGQKIETILANLSNIHVENKNNLILNDIINIADRLKWAIYVNNDQKSQTLEEYLKSTNSNTNTELSVFASNLENNEVIIFECEETSHDYNYGYINKFSY